MYKFKSIFFYKTILLFFVITLSSCQTAQNIQHSKNKNSSKDNIIPIIDEFYIQNFKYAVKNLRETQSKKTNIDNLKKEYQDSFNKTINFLAPSKNKKKLNKTELYQYAKQAVVKVGGVYLKSGDDKEKHYTSGKASGFLISDDGLVVTNNHVLKSLLGNVNKNTTKKKIKEKEKNKKGSRVPQEKYQSIFITTYDAEVYEVTHIMAANKSNDIAIIKIDTRGKKLPYLPLGDSMQTGEEVSVISHPQWANKANNFFLTTGIVSRYSYDAHTDGFAMSITADYAVGSSGSPILDNRGNAVGVVSSTKTYLAIGSSFLPQTQMVDKLTIPVKSIKNLISTNKKEIVENAPKNSNFNIKGQLLGLQGKTVHIYPLLKENIITDKKLKKTKPIATASISNGSFQLTGKLDKSPALVIFYVDNLPSTSAVIENGHMTIDLSKDRFNKDLLNINMKGSPFINQLQSLANTTLSVTNKKERAQKFLDHIYTHSHSPTSLFAATRLNEISDAPTLGYYMGATLSSGFHREVMLSDLGHSFSKFTKSFPEFNESTNSLNSKKSSKKSIKIGDNLKDFTHLDIQGKKINLKKLTQSNQYVLLDFWASWCLPCRKAMPKVVDLHKKYHKKGLKVVAISVDKDEDAWKEHIKKLNMSDFINIRSGNDYKNKKLPHSLYEAFAIPSTYLIDKKGKIIAIDLRGEALKKKIDSLFSKH